MSQLIDHIEVLCKECRKPWPSPEVHTCPECGFTQCKPVTSRAQFTNRQNHCWLCNTFRKRLECHEMPRGPARQRALLFPAAWILTCGRCHEDELDAMPIVDQLAIKRLVDPANYCRVSINRLRGRADGAITEEEVDKAVAKLERERDELSDIP